MNGKQLLHHLRCLQHNSSLSATKEAEAELTRQRASANQQRQRQAQQLRDQQADAQRLLDDARAQVADGQQRLLLLRRKLGHYTQGLAADPSWLDEHTVGTSSIISLSSKLASMRFGSPLKGGGVGVDREGDPLSPPDDADAAELRRALTLSRGEAALLRQDLTETHRALAHVRRERDTLQARAQQLQSEKSELLQQARQSTARCRELVCKSQPVF